MLVIGSDVLGPDPPLQFPAVAEWVDVERIARSLPETEVSTWYGTPGLKVGGKGFCRLRTDPDALVVRVIDLADRDALLAQDPEAFCITPHYAAAPYVLVRLEHVSGEELSELLEDAWRLTAPPRIQALFPAER
jgi:hypothetical protein